jgi:hypothetical protein
MEESENELDIDAAVCEEGAEKCQKARQNWYWREEGWGEEFSADGVEARKVKTERH